MRQALSRLIASPVLLGVVTGVLFGLWNLGAALLFPLAEDTVVALLSFYGPMFVVPGVAAFAAFRATGKWFEAIKASVVVAVICQLMFGAFNLIRVNLLLDTLTQRSDWQFLVASFHSSGAESFRTFVNLHYAQQTPPKLVAVIVISIVCGLIGAALAKVFRAPITASS